MIQELETNYQSKRSLTHVHAEFHALRQRSGENARNFEVKVDQLVLELYESMIEGEDFCARRDITSGDPSGDPDAIS